MHMIYCQCKCAICATYGCCGINIKSKEEVNSCPVVNPVIEKEKKPYKCPVCDGKCKHPHPLTGLLCSACDACEGKGIVWG